LFNVCAHCGEYSEEKVVEAEGQGPFAHAVCPRCGHRQRFRRLPLFVVSGPSGVGKTSVCLELAPRMSECVCLETDILWRGEFATPRDGYRAYREMWLRVALNVGQAGRPVALFGSGEPDGWEPCTGRRYFAEIHYLALVCDDAVLAERLRARPAWRGAGAPEFVDAMLEYNRSLKANAELSSPPITLLDTTQIGTRESAERVAAWIRERLR
jgi:hypothetical protein